MLEQHAARPPRLKRATLVLLGATVLVVAWTQREWLARGTGSELGEYTKVTPDTSLRNTDTVLLSVRSLARLESVSFHMERVIDLKQEQHRAFGMVTARDAILLIAAGDVVAGIDLAQLTAADIALKPEQNLVQLRVPPAQILSVSLDEKRTYVHSRQTSMLVKPGLDLETRARQQAVSAIKDAALEAGILERAHQSASQTLRALLLSLGYNVEFVHHE